MKKFFKWFTVAFLLLCLFFSCTQVRKNVISGQIEGLNAGDKVVLASWHASKTRWVADDSVTVKKPGQFTIKTYDKGEMLRLFLVPLGDTVDVADVRTPSLKLFAEGLGKYTVTGTVADFPKAKIVGGVYEYPEVKQIDSLNILRESLRQEAATMDRMDTSSVNRLNKRWEEVSNNILAAQKAVVKKYPDNNFAAWVLADLGFSYDAEEIDLVDSLYQGLADKVKSCLYGRNIKKRVENVRNSAQGGAAADFTLTSVAGDTVRLSDLKGKWVVLDFWASWCKPCRMYNPHMIDLYKKYSPAGLEVIGVAAWDADADWRKAIEEDGLPWTNVNSGEKMKGQDNVSETYAITSIPTTLLIDPDGKIVYRGHPSEIGDALKNAFPEVK